MEEVKKNLARLLDKKEWTKDDKQWLLKYLEHGGSEELKELVCNEFSNREAPVTSLDSDASAELLDVIHEKIGVLKPARPGAVISFWYRKFIAAAITGLCVISIYLVAHDKRERHADALKIRDRSENTKFKNDVAPGGNKALLKLADGSVIVLDDARNGTLVQQGGTKVLKINGKLAYKSAKAASGEILYNIISTPRGGEYQVILPDGSQVWLNAASSIRFPTFFKGSERRVEITGEAYFEVAKDAATPFIVIVNNSEVKVLGTHFNIMAYTEEGSLKTTLLEGSVQFISGDNKMMLKPGQQSQLAETGHIRVLNGVNLEEVVAWKNGMFHFERTDLETMMRQISRWYDVELVYENYKSEERFIADIPRNTNLSDVLKALELTGKVQFKVEHKKVIVQQL